MSVPPSKKRREGVVGIEGNSCLRPSALLRQLSQVWKDKKEFNQGDVRLSGQPFRFGEVRKFISSPLQPFIQEFRALGPFPQKDSDLFQFKQSVDLKSLSDPHHPHIQAIIEFLEKDVRPFLSALTSIPLKEEIDLFLSDYTQTDFLLCHDDELESRRLAFILYLSPDWTSDYGGNLDLFSATKDIHPGEILTSLTADFNKFVFFEVGPTSFHQVSEVREANVSRLALSGWFYGEPLPRPTIQFPQDEGYSLTSSIFTNTKDIMKEFCSESYTNPETWSDMNEQLTEESQVLVPAFLNPHVYSSICSDIVEGDLSTPSIFKPVGPANLASYEQTASGPPSPTSHEKDGEASSSTTTTPFNLQGLVHLFHSKDLLEFLERITEFPFTSCSVTKVSSSLRKYTRGSYALMKSGGRKETGEVQDKKTTEEVGDEEDEEEEEANYVDVTLYFASKWDEAWGGVWIYSTSEGEQLIRIPPEGNCLAVVVRTPSVNSYVNYINCLAKDEVYFAYTMTFAFNGKL